MGDAGTRSASAGRSRPPSGARSPFRKETGNSPLPSLSSRSVQHPAGPPVRRLTAPCPSIRDPSTVHRRYLVDRLPCACAGAGPQQHQGRRRRAVLCSFTMDQTSRSGRNISSLVFFSPSPLATGAGDELHRLRYKPR
jgi:hypothetical protein